MIYIDLKQSDIPGEILRRACRFLIAEASLHGKMWKFRVAFTNFYSGSCEFSEETSHLLVYPLTASNEKLQCSEGFLHSFRYGTSSLYGGVLK